MLKLIECLKKKKRFKIKAFGISMVPILRSNDIIYYKTIPFSRCNINDIIIIQKNKKVFTHRIIYKTMEYLISKGDNNYHSDGRVYKKQMIGKVYQVKRNGQIISPDSLYLLQSTAYFQEIVKIKHEFEKNRINLVFLKGLPLHLFFEGSHPRRIYADCDVLIEKINIKKIKGVFYKSGYKEISHSLSKTHKLIGKGSTEISFIKKINNYYINFDLHLEISPLYNELGDFSAFYNKELVKNITVSAINSYRIIKVQNEQFRILDTKFLIIFLLIHLFRHAFRGSFRYEFLASVIANVAKQSCIPRGLHRRQNNKTPRNDIWMEMSENINKYSLQNFVYPVFILLKKYYRTPLPKKFMSSIKPEKGKMKFIQRNIFNINIFDDETRIAGGVNRFKNLFFLSPNPLWKRLMIIFNIQVVYSVLWVLVFMGKKSFKKLFK